MQSGPIAEIIIGPNYSNSFRVRVGKPLKNAGVVDSIVFDHEEHEKTGNMIFNIYAKKENGEVFLTRQSINQPALVIFKSELE
jgi:hypothetical protein